MGGVGGVEGVRGVVDNNLNSASGDLSFHTHIARYLLRYPNMGEGGGVGGGKIVNFMVTEIT